MEVGTNLCRAGTTRVSCCSNPRAWSGNSFKRVVIESLCACYLDSCAMVCSGFCLFLYPKQPIADASGCEYVQDEHEQTSAEAGKLPGKSTILTRWVHSLVMYRGNCQVVAQM